MPAHIPTVRANTTTSATTLRRLTNEDNFFFDWRGITLSTPRNWDAYISREDCMILGSERDTLVTERGLKQRVCKLSRSATGTDVGVPVPGARCQQICKRAQPCAWKFRQALIGVLVLLVDFGPTPQQHRPFTEGIISNNNTNHEFHGTEKHQSESGENTLH